MTGLLESADRTHLTLHLRNAAELPAWVRKKLKPASPAMLNGGFAFAKPLARSRAPYRKRESNSPF